MLPPWSAIQHSMPNSGSSLPLCFALQLATAPMRARCRRPAPCPESLRGCEWRGVWVDGCCGDGDCSKLLSWRGFEWQGGMGD